MRHEVTEAEIEQAHSADLAEAFELFVQQRFYLDVNTVNGHGPDQLYASLIEFSSDAGIFNASHAFDRISNISENGNIRHEIAKNYPYRAALENGDATQTFYRYDTLADAMQHAAELLAGVNVSI